MLNQYLLPNKRRKLKAIPVGGQIGVTLLLMVESRSPSLAATK